MGAVMACTAYTLGIFRASSKHVHTHTLTHAHLDQYTKNTFKEEDNCNRPSINTLTISLL